MKKPKPNTVTIAPVKPYDNLDPANLPTQEQLAQLAASMVDGDIEKVAAPVWSDKCSAPIFVRAAMRIWHQAGRQLSVDAYFNNDKRDYLLNGPFTEEDFAAGNKYITRDKFFQRVMPLSRKHRTGDVASISKGFIRYQRFEKQFEWGGPEKEFNETEFYEIYRNWRINGILNANVVARQFYVWYRNHIKQARRTAGLKSVAKRIPSSRSK